MMLFNSGFGLLNLFFDVIVAVIEFVFELIF